MHFLMPQTVIDRYWRSPHFRPLEIMLCSQEIYAPLRTQMLIATMVFPGIARKRHFSEKLAIPRWYLMAARSLIIWGITAFTGFITILAGLYIYAIITGRTSVPNPAEFSLTGKIMLAMFVFCVAFFIARHWRSSRSRRKN